MREFLWGCEYPQAGKDWFVYLPSYGFSWWLIGEVEDQTPYQNSGTIAMN